MRIHIDLPTSTTVSVDDDLMALLGAALVLEHPAQHADAKEQISRARRFVKSVAAQYGLQSSDGVSRTVQRAIFRRIADPQALAIFDSRDSEEAKAKATAAHLEECAQKGWQTPEQIAEKKRRKALIAEAKKQRKVRTAMRQALPADTKENETSPVPDKAIMAKLNVCITPAAHGAS